MVKLFRSTPFLLALFILAADQLSKAYTVFFIPPARYSSFFYPYNGIPVFQDFLGVEFSIIYTTNKGAAWGALADFQTQLLIFRIILIMTMLGYLLFFNKNRSQTLPLAMVVAGAFGNVIDYFVYGHVIDMLHFVLWGYDFPVFNLADTAITLGIAWLCLLSWCQTGERKFKPASK